MNQWPTPQPRITFNRKILMQDDFLPDPRYPFISKKLRRLKSDQLLNPSFAHPLHGKDITIGCRECSHEYPPPWTKPLPGEITPLVPDENKPGAWFQVGFPIECPKCNAINFLSIPEVKTESYRIVNLFGDEAFQDLTGRRILYVYILFSSTGYLRRLIREKIKSIKISLCPEVKIDSWNLHLSEIRSTYWRKKNNISIPIEKMNEIVNSLFSLIGSKHNQRLIFGEV